MSVDQEQGDGLYSGVYLPFSAGKYSVMATVNGIRQSGVAFEINAGTEFTVLPRFSKLTGAFRDFGVDINNDQFFDKIVIEIDTDTTVAGEYGAFVHLKTNNGKRLVKAARKNLAAGLGNIQVDFDAKSIRELNENGPHQIERVDLLRYTDVQVNTIHMLRNVGQTQPYQTSQMQLPALYFTGNNAAVGIDANVTVNTKPCKLMPRSGQTF